MPHRIEPTWLESLFSLRYFVGSQRLESISVCFRQPLPSRKSSISPALPRGSPHSTCSEQTDPLLIEALPNL
jgi:hypothetical protein